MKTEDRTAPGCWLVVLALVLAFGIVKACGPTPPPSNPPPAPTSAGSTAESTSFRIVAESEVKTLEDAGILDAFTKETGIQLSMDYRGPVDIRNAVSNLSKKNPKTVDAYWPGSSLWLPGSSTVQPTSVMKTYVVLAVDPAVAKDLGWDAAKGMTASDLVDAIQAKKIRLAMTSATQSTPGAVFYLAMYTGLTGKSVLTSEDLANAELRDRIRSMLTGIERSGVDLDRLKQVFIDDKISGAHRTNAIVIYESLAIQMNKALIASSQMPMTIFYVGGATAIADVPLRYVDNGDANKLEEYRKLVAFLNRPEVQQSVQALGWRTNPIGMKCPDCDPGVFNPDWGINTSVEFQEMIFPKPPVATAALDWYQCCLRKASFTVYCLDYSGSMEIAGGPQMVDAMDLLLDQDRASKVLLQATPDDITLVYAFSSQVLPVGAAVTGNDQTALKNLSSQISAFKMGGNTALFDCVESALTYIGTSLDSRYSYSVIALTDGGSNEGASASDFAAFYKSGNFSIPVYGIALGSADFTQLNQFKMTGGDVYDGREDVAGAFRKARGNN